MKTILILAANPKGTTALRLDQEVRDIREALKLARDRASFQLEQRAAVEVFQLHSMGLVDLLM